MKKTLADLQRERARLTARIGAERAAVASQLVPFQRAAETSDKVSAFVVRAMDYARAHPLTMAAALAVVAVFKPRTSLRWIKRGLIVWRGWRTVRTLRPLGLLQQLRRFF
jgi:phage host-nuclease inhibitor protein Gam